MLRRRVESLSGNDDPRRIPLASFVPTPTYPHVTSHRSLQMELRIYSPSVKVVSRNDKRPSPVFGDGDQIGGTVILDPSCANNGRVTVSIEGAFFYPQQDKSIDRGKHVFFTASTVFPTSPMESGFGAPRSAFLRDAFASHVRRRPSTSSMQTAFAAGVRSFPFTFDLPHSARTGEEIPPTFASTISSSDTHFPPRPTFTVEYKINVLWEPNDASEYPSFLDVPILFFPDPDFESLDGRSGDQGSTWLEMPLRSDLQKMPFRCAVTLPTSVTFSRSSSIPYFVVFTTTPRSPQLAREIASDATISVSVLRQVTITQQGPFPPTPPQTPSSDDSESPRGKFFRRRIAKTAAPLMYKATRSSDEVSDHTASKPLPRLPTETAFSETQILHTSMAIGFPKRPRGQSKSDRKHPTLDEHISLPDGLHKSKILLNKDMLPCIDWAGVSVKYYLDVSVSFGQNEFRARLPIRVM